jgi:hypothetical protein
MLPPVQFSAWHKLDDAGRLAPAAPGVLQARAERLLPYPTGRSAMVFYDASRGGTSLAAWVCQGGGGQEGLGRAQRLGASLVRFGAAGLRSPDAAKVRSPEEELERLLASFRERFGRTPLANAEGDLAQGGLVHAAPSSS